MPAAITRTFNRPLSRGDLKTIGTLVVLLTGYVAASAALWSYKQASGELAPAPPIWPSDSRIERSEGLPTLVLFAHPMCPCTDASLAELRVLLGTAQRPVKTVVAFGIPNDRRTQWANSRSWSAAQALTGAEPLVDEEQREAHRFGARTSGQVVLYDSQGALLFSGGITDARGHEGDNEGLARLTNALETGLASPGSPVFGCPLESEPTALR